MEINKKDIINNTKKIAFLIIPFITVPFIYEIFIAYSKNLFNSGYCNVLNFRALEHLKLVNTCSGISNNVGADSFLSGAGLVFGIPLYLLNALNFALYLKYRRKRK
ncbi:hypothetical protein [Sebaldella sp. S0638]|uniref:hypothetical protein n=1 Tax=Sebaldella sp. S0638 TaxID=2957809 RepID=UPI00209DA033|nr:hypothetical protein [Sebaldella sp. S0638]MCP1226250.1 hypothetical protein [Sebaldella sp. S0638]